MEALAGWKAAAWAAFSSIGGLPGGVVVKWRSEVAEADGLAFLGFSVGGRGFCVILGDHDRSRYPATHAPCPVEPAVHQPRIPMAARRSTARSPRSGRFRHPRIAAKTRRTTEFGLLPSSTSISIAGFRLTRCDKPISIHVSPCYKTEQSDWLIEHAAWNSTSTRTVVQTRGRPSADHGGGFYRKNGRAGTYRDDVNYQT